VDSWRLTLSLRSSQIFSMLTPAGVDSLVASAQKVSASVFSARKAMASMERSVLPLAAPLGVAGADRAVPMFVV